MDRLFIRQKLEEYGASGMLAHLREKVVFTWGDGVYFAPEKLQRDPLKESWLHDWVRIMEKTIPIHTVTATPCSCCFWAEFFCPFCEF